MSHDLVAYPTTLGDSVTIVIDALRGRGEGKEELVHAAYHVVGYGLNKIMPHERIALGSGQLDAVGCSKEECADLLERAASHEEPAPAADAGDNPRVAPRRKKAKATPAPKGAAKGEEKGADAVDGGAWLSIIVTLLPLIEQWLRNRK